MYFWLQVEFVAAVQIALYVGGIVVLIIFSIFLTQQSGMEMPKAPVKRTITSVLAVLIGFVFTFFLIYQHDFKGGDGKMDTDVARIGTLMLSTGDNGFALPFEVISILLLAAMIGCIVIAAPSKKGKETNTQETAPSKSPPTGET